VAAVEGVGEAERKLGGVGDLEALAAGIPGRVCADETLLHRDSVIGTFGAPSRLSECVPLRVINLPLAPGTREALVHAHVSGAFPAPCQRRAE
jgi:hypothetical protein